MPDAFVEGSLSGAAAFLLARPALKKVDTFGKMSKVMAASDGDQERQDRSLQHAHSLPQTAKRAEESRRP
jgi:hypothetical protein